MVILIYITISTVRARAAAKRIFFSVYIIDKCFLFHVITGKCYFFKKFVVTCRIFSTAIYVIDVFARTLPSRIYMLPGISVVVGKMSHF